MKSNYQNKVNVFGGMLTIIGTIVGGGIVGIPFSTLKIGICLAIIVHALNLIGGIYSVYLLLEAKDITGLASFSELGYFCFGRSSIFMINMLVSMTQLGLTIIYFMIIGSIGNGLFKYFLSYDFTNLYGAQITIIASGIFLLYFSIKKEIQELYVAGFLLLAGVVIFMITMTLLLLIDGVGDFDYEEISRPKFDVEMFANIPTVFLAYGFQTSFFPAFQSLNERSNKNGMIVSIFSLGFCGLVYFMMSIVSILHFGHNLKGNVLENVADMESSASIIINLIFLFVVTMHIPIIFFVGKEAFLIIIDEIMRKSYSTYPREVVDDAFLLKDTYHENTGDAAAEGKAYLTMHPVLFYCISAALYIVVVFLSCVITDLVFVFGFIGSFCGTYYQMRIGNKFE